MTITQVRIYEDDSRKGKIMPPTVIEVGGHDIGPAVSAAVIDMKPGHLPAMTITIPSFVDFDGLMFVKLDPASSAALAVLGWAPPPGETQPPRLAGWPGLDLLPGRGGVEWHQAPKAYDALAMVLARHYPDANGNCPVCCDPEGLPRAFPCPTAQDVRTQLEARR